MSAVRIFKALRELTDVDLDGLADGALLKYDGATETWKPLAPGALGAVRVIEATLLQGSDTLVVALNEGERVAAVPCQQRPDGGVQFQGVNYSENDAILQFTGAPDADLAIIITVKLP